jgi:probable F420-dependent oxidoreductase
MNLGFSLPVAGEWATPENQVRIARHAEDLGYDSLWAFQRLLYPLEPKNEYYGAPGKAWPKPFERTLDPIVSLAHVAGATRRIRLGTSVLIIPFYSPTVLAKQLATLDCVSGGRLHVGLGLGWSEDEYDAVGVPFARRGARADEFVRCLTAIWRDDPVEFRGEFYTVPRSRVEPKPLQTPRPPLTIGGYAKGVLRRAATLADGYNGGNIPLADMAGILRQLAEAAESVGKDPRALQIVCRGTFLVHETAQGPNRRALFGTLQEVRDDIRRYADAGVTELFLEANFQPGGASVERALPLMEALRPAGR